MIQQPLAIFVLLLAVVLFSLWLTGRFRWAERLSPVLWILFLAALLSNSGLLPTEADLYGTIVGISVPFAVCLVLFMVRLADVRRAGGTMLFAFALAAAGTVVGVVVAGLLLRPWLTAVLGDESWKLAGPYAGTYIGGSLNFFALWEGLELGRPDLFAAANAVDNLTIFPLMACWILLPTWLGSRFPVAARWRRQETERTETERTETEHPETEPPAAAPRLIPIDVVALCTLAFAILWVSGALKTLLDPLLPGLPEILIVTTLALVAGQVPAVRRRQGSTELGYLAFYLFFAAVGAMINVKNAILLAPILFAYVLVVMVCHMIVVYGGGRLLRMDIGVLTVASIATKAGPPLVLAMADKGPWRHLALPGVLVGLLGYALGNYVGFAVAYLMRVWS